MVVEEEENVEDGYQEENVTGLVVVVGSHEVSKDQLLMTKGFYSCSHNTEWRFPFIDLRASPVTGA